MSLKIRKLTPSLAKLMNGLALIACLLQSGCVTDALTSAPPPPTVSVADVTKPSAKADTPPLTCKIGRGSALFGRDWYDFRDVTFSLRRGERTDIKLTRMRGAQQMTVQALFDGSGQKIIFCPFLKVSTPDQRIACSSLYALDDDLQDGIKRTFDIPAALRGGAITCAYDIKRLRSLAVPPGN